MRSAPDGTVVVWLLPAVVNTTTVVVVGASIAPDVGIATILDDNIEDAEKLQVTDSEGRLMNGTIISNIISSATTDTLTIWWGRNNLERSMKMNSWAWKLSTCSEEMSTIFWTLKRWFDSKAKRLWTSCFWTGLM